MNPPSLPAGIASKDVELFYHEDPEHPVHATYDTQIMDFNNLPEKIKEEFRSLFLNNKPAIKSLQEDFGLTDVNEMFVQYLKCNFGNFDGTPDLSQAGQTTKECWDCGQRNTCPGEGKVCSRPSGPNGMLTKRETEIVFLLLKGKIDKEIACEFGISLATIETHLKRIREALGCSNRIEIMNYALNRKLI